MATKTIIQAKFNGRRIASGTGREVLSPAKLRDLVRASYESKKVNFEKESLSR